MKQIIRLSSFCESTILVASMRSIRALTLLVMAFVILTGGCVVEESSLAIKAIDPGNNTTGSNTDDSDGNENPQSNPTPPDEPQSPPTVADITDLILITGQSNALGAGTSYDYTIDTPDNRVFAYTSDGWQMADLHQIHHRHQQYR